MPYKNILQNIRRFVLISPEQEHEFCTLLTIRKIKKKEIILREGDVCINEYFVNKGCMREYFVDQKGIEHNVYFAIEGWWILDLYSRTQMAPTCCNIAALEDSELVQINHFELESFMLKVPGLERFFRILYQNSLVAQHMRSLQMLYMTATDRYIYFRQHYPKVADRIPQKHMATFLGLTPEFFNTVHARVTRYSQNQTL
jgi:CRP-like cAMP-binding protein